MAKHMLDFQGKKQEFAVTHNLQNRRLDFAISVLAGLPRSASRKLVESALVLINGQRENFPSRKVAAGDRLTILIPPDAKSSSRELKIIHEDPAIIVVDKPPGMLTNKGGGEKGAALEDRLKQMGKSVFPVHRLDRDTSGVVLFAKTEKARDFLLNAFRSRQVSKKYLGIVAGVMREKKGILRGIISKGEYAVTIFNVLQTMRNATLLELYPRTGRTHQIRIQLARLGYPLIGEKKYLVSGSPEVLFPRQALHAVEIKCTHPLTNKTVKYFAPMPGDMKALLKKSTVN